MGSPILMCFFYVSMFLCLSQVAGVQKDSCCRTTIVCLCQSVAVVFHQAMGHWSTSLKRNLPLTVTPGEKRFILQGEVSKLQWLSFKLLSIFSRGCLTLWEDFMCPDA